MRTVLIAATALLAGTPAFAQLAPVARPDITRRVVEAVQPRTDIAVNNPTTMQLRVQIAELSAKVDSLISIVEAQAGTLAAVDGKLTSANATLAQFRQASEDQYKKLRMTTFLDCYQTAAHSTWGYGEGEVAIRHCTGELGPADKVPF